MKNWTRFRTSILLSPLALVAFAQSASAHIEITAPEPREPGEDTIKQGPCGTADWGAATVHEHAPGDVVTLTWDETIPHSGYFRVVLSLTGDAGLTAPTEASYDAYSNDAPPAPVVGPVTEGDMIVYYDYYEPHVGGGGGDRSVDIVLPQATCAECTLQLIQMMHDEPNPQPFFQAYYYGCVDLTIAGEVSAGGAGAGGGSAVGGESALGGSGMGGSAGAPVAMGGGGGNGLVAPSGGMGGQGAIGVAGRPMQPMMAGAAGQAAAAGGAPPLMMGGLAGTPAATAGTTGAPIAAGGAPAAQAGAAGMTATGTGTAPAASCSTSGGSPLGIRGLGLFALALIGAGWRRRRPAR